MVLVITFGLVFGVTIIVIFWWIIHCYFGSSLATLVTLIFLLAFIFMANKLIDEPSEQELKTFHEKRKGVGY